MIAMVPNPNLSGETPKTNRLSYDQVPSNTLANTAIKTAKSAKILRKCYKVQFFPGGIKRPRHDADPSPPSSAEV